MRVCLIGFSCTSTQRIVFFIIHSLCDLLEQTLLLANVLSSIISFSLNLQDSKSIPILPSSSHIYLLSQQIMCQIISIYYEFCSHVVPGTKKFCQKPGLDFCFFVTGIENLNQYCPKCWFIKDDDKWEDKVRKLEQILKYLK